MSLEAFADDIRQAAAERGITLTNELVYDAYTSMVANDNFNEIGTRQYLDQIVNAAGPSGPAWEPEWEHEEQDEAPAFNEELFSAHFQRDAAEVQRNVGRRLTAREVDTLASGALDQVNRHGSFDLSQARWEHGIKSWDEMDPGEEDRAMAERARELGSSDSAEIEIEVGEDGRPASDADWDKYMTARLQGHEAVDWDEGMDGGEDWEG